MPVAGNAEGRARRILVIADILPFPARANGFAIRYAPIIERLLDDHDVEFALLDRYSASVHPAPTMPIPIHRIALRRSNAPLWRRIVARLIAGFAGVPPYPMYEHGESSIIEPLQRLCEDRRIDLIILTHPEVIGAVRRAAGARRLVVDAIDSRYLTVLRQGGGSLLARYDAWQTRRWERRLPELASHVTYISEFDRDSVRPAASYRDHVSVIPNGVLAEDASELPTDSRVPGRIAFLGHMGYPPNIRAAARLALLLPRIRERVPNAGLHIIGRSPSREIEMLRKQDGVTVTGDVPSIWPELYSAGVACFPMEEGAGQQNKLLEAMYARCAVVTSTVGNLGIRGKDDVDLLVRDSDEALVETLSELLMCPHRASALGAAGHEFVKNNYTWSASFERIRQYWLTV